MNKRRVWFNKSFSSIYNVFRLLRGREAVQPLEIICTHSNGEFVGFAACDESALEPAGLGEEAYVEHCLAFCAEHGVEVFVPGKSKVAVARARGRFEAQGVKVLLAASAEAMDAYERKGEFYAGLDPAAAAAPRFVKVNTAAEFSAACDSLRAEGLARLCIKPAMSTGGLGFKILDDSRTDLRNLFGGEVTRVTTASVALALAQEERFRDLLVMEYLDGAEYSIDCLAERGRLIRAVARRKPVRLGGTQLLEDKPELLALAERLTRACGLDAIFNIQVRYAGEVPKLLEINARMSGGLYFACLSGVNLPGWAIALACGDAREEDIPQPRLGVKVHQQYHEFVFTETQTRAEAEIQAEGGTQAEAEA